jgi:SAM-dependent methyltransferase
VRSIRPLSHFSLLPVGRHASQIEARRVLHNRADRGLRLRTSADLRESSAVTTPGPIGNTYDKYASVNPIERRLMAGFLAKLDSLLPSAAPRRVLEVGVGEGKVATRLRARYPDAVVIGLDLPDPELREQWMTSGLTGLFASADRLPFVDDTFDLVVGIEMLEHVPYPDRVLSEIARVAKGPVIVTVPWEPAWRIANMARGAYLRQLGNTPGHIQHWTKRRFQAQVARHLRVISSSISFPWTLVRAEVRPVDASPANV